MITSINSLIDVDPNSFPTFTIKTPHNYFI